MIAEKNRKMWLTLQRKNEQNVFSNLRGGKKIWWRWVQQNLECDCKKNECILKTDKPGVQVAFKWKVASSILQTLRRGARHPRKTTIKREKKSQHRLSSRRGQISTDHRKELRLGTICDTEKKRKNNESWMCCYRLVLCPLPVFRLLASGASYTDQIYCRERTGIHFQSIQNWSWKVCLWKKNTKRMLVLSS